ncbi:MAG TPA: response regulator [Thermodesulfovibrionales bacterium]|jgi:CheY-like chemotaxis protein|nr:response regulator [Thermodesulfovibrionales bacterium]
MANILVVDDEDVIRYALYEVLERYGHIVTEASDGMEALDVINRNPPPDLILMNHQMPRLSGIDCARQLRTVHPSLKIVLMSSSFGIDDDGYLASNKHSFTDILLKPFRLRDMVSTVEYALERKEQEKITLFEYSNSTTTIIPRITPNLWIHPYFP